MTSMYPSKVTLNYNLVELHPKPCDPIFSLYTTVTSCKKSEKRNSSI